LKGFVVRSGSCRETKELPTIKCLRRLEGSDDKGFNRCKFNRASIWIFTFYSVQLLYETYSEPNIYHILYICITSGLALVFSLTNLLKLGNEKNVFVKNYNL